MVCIRLIYGLYQILNKMLNKPEPNEGQTDGYIYSIKQYLSCDEINEHNFIISFCHFLFGGELTEVLLKEKKRNLGRDINHRGHKETRRKNTRLKRFLPQKAQKNTKDI
jgi:hypothetical protein